MICGHYQGLLNGMGEGSASAYPRTFLIRQVLGTIEGKVTRDRAVMAVLEGRSIHVRKYTVQLASTLAELWADEAGRLMRVYMPVQDVEPLSSEWYRLRARLQ